MKRIEYKEDEFLLGSNLILIKNLGSIYGNTGRPVRKGLFKCFCGNIFEATINQVKARHTTSCGCAKISLTILRNTRHGLTHDPTYRVWQNMKERIFNKKCKDYYNYGGRDIAMFPSWREDFQLFYDYVSSLPDFGRKGYSLDRINTNGNYEYGNLRWTTQHIQCVNIHTKRNNSSGYTGIGKLREGWQATVGQKYIGCAKTINDTVTLRNNYIIANNLTEYKIQEVIK